MIRRVRMARKRLMVARERNTKAIDKWIKYEYQGVFGDDWLETIHADRERRLRAIERRKDRIS